MVSAQVFKSLLISIYHPLSRWRKKSVENDIGRFSFLLGISYGFLITTQASRHKARKHKLRRCRFGTVISATYNYRRVCLSSKEERGKKKRIIDYSQHTIPNMHDAVRAEDAVSRRFFENLPAYLRYGSYNTKLNDF